MLDHQDSFRKVRAIEWLAEIGIQLPKSRPANYVFETSTAPPQPQPMTPLQTAGAITICLLLLGYCFGVVLFPNLGF